jgi:hypothetical protein
MDGHHRSTSIDMLQEVVAALDADDLESKPSQSFDQLPACD